MDLVASIREGSTRAFCPSPGSSVVPPSTRRPADSNLSPPVAGICMASTPPCCGDAAISMRTGVSTNIYERDNTRRYADGTHRRSTVRPIAVLAPPSPGQVALVMRLAAPPGHLRPARWLTPARDGRRHILSAVRFSRNRRIRAPVTNPSPTGKSGGVVRLAAATATGRSPLRRPAE